MARAQNHGAKRTGCHTVVAKMLQVWYWWIHFVRSIILFEPSNKFMLVYQRLKDEQDISEWLLFLEDMFTTCNSTNCNCNMLSLTQPALLKSNSSFLFLPHQPTNPKTIQRRVFAEAAIDLKAVALQRMLMTLLILNWEFEPQTLTKLFRYLNCRNPHLYGYGLWIRETPPPKIALHPRNLTARPWKMMVGSDDPFLLGPGLFSGANC